MSANFTKQAETIKAKGASAYYAGQSIDDCPYKLNGKQSRRYKRIWLAGFIEARETGAPSALYSELKQ